MSGAIWSTERWSRSGRLRIGPPAARKTAVGWCLPVKSSGAGHVAERPPPGRSAPRARRARADRARPRSGARGSRRGRPRRTRCRTAGARPAAPPTGGCGRRPGARCPAARRAVDDVDGVDRLAARRRAQAREHRDEPLRERVALGEGPRQHADRHRVELRDEAEARPAPARARPTRARRRGSTSRCAGRRRRRPGSRGRMRRSARRRAPSPARTSPSARSTPTSASRITPR